MATSAVPWAAVDAIARRQYGLVTAAQLERIGFGEYAREGLFKAGRLIKVRRGVFRLCGATSSWRSSALAAVLAAGSDALLSHASAVALWGLFDEQDLQGRLDLIAPHQLRMRGVTGHRSLLLPGDVTRRHFIPVTSIERTLLDLSDDQPPKAVGRLLDEAIRRKYTTTGRVDRMLATRRGKRRGVATIRQVLAERGVGYDPGANDWERAMDRMWEAMGLPAAVRQYTIRLPGGRKYRPDRVMVSARITVDWNGYAWHGLRSDFERDIERRNLLIAHGWTPLEFHSNQSPEHICRTVLQVHERQIASSLPAS